MSDATRLAGFASSLNADSTVPAIQISGSVQGASTHTHVWNEVPSGTVDGANGTFTLAGAPVGGSLLLFRNGLLMQRGSGNDYTLVSATITFQLGNFPQSGDILLASYTT